MNKFIISISFIFFCGGTIYAQKVKAKKKSSNLTKTSILGTFESNKGVMTELSCYCFNSGTLTNLKGESTSICFNDTVKTPLSNSKIKVTGMFVELKNNPEPTNPCPKGTMNIFKVYSFVYVK